MLLGYVVSCHPWGGGGVNAKLQGGSCHTPCNTMGMMKGEGSESLDKEHWVVHQKKRWCWCLLWCVVCGDVGRERSGTR